MATGFAITVGATVITIDGITIATGAATVATNGLNA
jgi:hypothetical protein